MFFKKKRNDGIDVNEIATGVIKEKSAVSKIIGGKLYDTSRATHICDLCLWSEKIPEYKLMVHSLGGEDVSLYKGNTEWFISYHCVIQPVSEEWVRDILGVHNGGKDIEQFGEPELA